MAGQFPWKKDDARNARHQVVQDRLGELRYTTDSKVDISPLRANTCIFQKEKNELSPPAMTTSYVDAN